MTTITKLSEDDRSLIMWDVREWCDTYAMYNPGHQRRALIRSCFYELRGWMNYRGIRWALSCLEEDRNRIAEQVERRDALEAAYWHRAPRSWE